jgi:hypothetical protein
MVMLNFLLSWIAYATGMSSLVYFFWTLQFGVSVTAPFHLQLLLRDTTLFLIFPLQHSLMPRSFIKKRMSPYLHRPAYVFISGIALWIVLLFWKPFGPVIYRDVAPQFFFVVYVTSLILIVLSTVALGHARMFGLSYGYAAWKKLPLQSDRLESHGIYSIVRHPITSLLLIALWAHPTLTADRLVWNVLFSTYSIVGTLFEERSLIKEFGKDYQEYCRRVPPFFPKLAKFQRR